MQIEIGGAGAGGTGSGVQKVNDAAELALLVGNEGDLVVQLDSGEIYYYSGSSWVLYLDGATLGDAQQALSDAGQALTDAGQALTDAATAQGDATQAITEIGDHRDDTVDAHDASAISVVATGNLASTDVQNALQELQGDIDTLAGVSHVAATIGSFSGTPTAQGLSITGQDIALTAADATNPGGVSTGAQTLGGEKRLPGGLHIGSDALGASVAFGVTSTTKGAIAAPAMTTAQRDGIGTPATGLRIYNTDNGRPEYYDGTLWQSENSFNVAADQTPANASTPTILGYRRQVVKMTGSGGAVTLTDLSVANNKNGDELVILGGSDSSTVTINSATNTDLNGSCTLGDGDMLSLILLGGVWREVTRSA